MSEERAMNRNRARGRVSHDERREDRGRSTSQQSDSDGSRRPGPLTAPYSSPSTSSGAGASYPVEYLFFLM